MNSHNFSKTDRKNWAHFGKTSFVDVYVRTEDRIKMTVSRF